MPEDDITDAQEKQAELINAELKRLWESDNMMPLTFEEVLSRTAWYTAIFTKYFPDHTEPLSVLSEALYKRMGNSRPECFTGKGSDYVH